MNINLLSMNDPGSKSRSIPSPDPAQTRLHPRV